MNKESIDQIAATTIHRIESTMADDSLNDYGKLTEMQVVMNDFYREQAFGKVPNFNSRHYKSLMAGEPLEKVTTHVDAVGRQFSEEDVREAYEAGKESRESGSVGEAPTSYGDVDEISYVAWQRGCKGEELNLPALIEFFKNMED